MSKASTLYAKKTVTPKSVRSLNSDQVHNNSGGAVHLLSDFDTLKRFLLIGTEGGTYYQSEQDLTSKNIEIVEKYVKTNANQVLDIVQDYLVRGAAPKRVALIYTLAYIAKRSGSPSMANRAYLIASNHLNTPTDFFDFASCIKNLGGFSTGFKKCIARWYANKTDNKLDYHLAKYQQRNGWTHKDLLNLAHIPYNPETVNRNELIKFAVFKEGELTPSKNKTTLPDYLSHPNPDTWNVNTWSTFNAKNIDNVADIVKLIREFKLPFESIPKPLLKEKEVWEALLVNMPMQATLRNLNNFQKHGLLEIGSASSKIVIDRINSLEAIKSSRIHPIAILLASTMWNGTNSRLKEALESAFKLAMQTVEPSGKSFIVALDTSGSMDYPINGYPIPCVEFGAKLAKVIYDTEPGSYVGVFSHKFKLVTDPNKIMEERVFGSTDPSSVITYLLEKNISIDCIITITDNECNRGYNFTDILKKYREKVKKNVKLVVIGLTSTNFSIGDPKDPYVLGIAGFDPSVPAMISEFAKT